MTIVLTGTGSSQNIPAFRCRCDVCIQARKSGNKNYRRKNSSAVVSVSGNQTILIDVPPQFLSQLENHGLNDLEINHLLLTHRHEDHLLGLFHLLSVNGKKGAVLESPIQVYHGRSTGEHLNRHYPVLSAPGKMKRFEGTLERIEIEDLKSFGIGSCRVTPLETNHLKIKSSDPVSCSDESLGFLFSDTGVNFYYLVDAAETLPPKTIKYMENNPPDCIVIDCTYSVGDLTSGHGDLESVLSFRERFPEGRFIISHISHMNHKPEILQALLHPAGVEVGYDGMEISL